MKFQQVVLILVAFSNNSISLFTDSLSKNTLAKVSNLESCHKNHIFQPIEDTTVSGPCTWEIWTSKNLKRIPSEITEVYCSRAGVTCNWNTMYKVYKN